MKVIHLYMHILAIFHIKAIASYSQNIIKLHCKTE